MLPGGLFSLRRDVRTKRTKRTKSPRHPFSHQEVKQSSAAYPTQAQKQGLSPISCHAVLETSACAPFIKERRMEFVSATSLRRKSGQMGHPTFDHLGWRAYGVRACIPSCQSCFIKRTHWAYPSQVVILLSAGTAGGRLRRRHRPRQFGPDPRADAFQVVGGGARS